MVVFPCAKVNIGLHVLERRADGFHSISTIMQPIPLHDILEVIVDTDAAAGSIHLERSGIPVPGNTGTDLVYRAAQALLQHHAPDRALRMHLHKNIPIGAGLGGGSSDAASAIRVVTQVLGISPTEGELHALAAELGSDVPFFLLDGPALASGRGEILEPLPALLQGRWMVLTNPGLHVATADVYRNTIPIPARVDMAQAWRAGDLAALDNDMEAYVARTHPEVEQLVQLLRSNGASYTAMSGSGSSVFGLFPHSPRTIDWPVGTRHWMFRL